MSERVGTNDTYYEACRKLADIAIRTERYYASAHQPCITEQEIVEFEEWHWRKKNMIEKTLDYHRCEGENYLSDLKKRRTDLLELSMYENETGLDIYVIDRRLYEFQCKEREAWFRDMWMRWTLHVEDFRLHFGHKPIVENWTRLKQQALTFIQDII